MQRSTRTRAALTAADSESLNGSDDDGEEVTTRQSYYTNRGGNGDPDGDQQQLLHKARSRSEDGKGNSEGDKLLALAGGDEAAASDADDDDDSAFWDADDGDDGATAALSLPPPLPDTHTDHSIIDVLAEALLQREIPAYMEAFEIVVPDAEIVVGSVPMHELEQREQDVEEAKLRRAELESEQYRVREAHLIQQEVRARERLFEEARARHARLEQQKLQLVHAMQLRARRLGYVFQQAENHLKTELERQQAHVEQLYGQLAHSRVPQSRKRFRVEWQKIPVTLKLRVRMLSAVKDKLPAGHYVLVATLYDRLGGHALHWSAWDPEFDAASKQRGSGGVGDRRRGQQHNTKPKPSRSDDLDGDARVGSQIRLGKPNFTRPFHHRGRFYNTDVVVNQSVFVVCPPECALRPGNVLIFELFYLAAAHSSMRLRHPQRQQPQSQQQQSDDQVVAWGALPLSTPDCECVRGKFKIPLLRGEMDPTMDKFRDIEQMYESDLSAWLCNLYVDATHLPKRLPRDRGRSRSRSRSQAGGGDIDTDGSVDDFDVEIDERSGLFRVENNHQRYMRKLTKTHVELGRSSRSLVLQDEDNSDGNGAGSRDTGAPVEPASQLRLRRTAVAPTSAEDVHPLPSIGEDDHCTQDALTGGTAGASAAAATLPGDATMFPSSRTLLLDGSEGGDEGRDRAQRKTRSHQQPSHHSSAFPPALSSLRRAWKRFVSPKKSTRVYSGEMADDSKQTKTNAKRQAGGESDSEPLASGPERCIRQQRASRSVFASSTGDASDDDEDDNEDGDATPAIDTENYRFSVNDAASVETAQHRRFHMQRKLYYLRHELLTDVGGAANVRTLEFWRFTALLLAALWLRVYVHYVMQWLYLRGSRVPVYDFHPQWTTCVVKYTWRTLATRTELGVVAIGVVGNVLLFGGLAIAAAVMQTFVGELPHFASTFIVCVGVAAVLDPYLVLLVDVVQRHYDCSSSSAACAQSLAASACTCVDGDAFKLYVRFRAQEGSGVVGVALTVMLYAALTCGALVSVYAYVLHVHMNGRMLDVYRRVHGHEDAFFVPHDREVALAELLAICAHAQRWKGPRGSQRKVFVHAYTLTDPLDAAFTETNVHIAVYTLELDGTRELHRHFLKAPDGAILELFGAIGTGRDGAWLNGAHATVASLALLHTILQDQQHGGGAASDSATEASPEHLAALFTVL